MSAFLAGGDSIVAAYCAPEVGKCRHVQTGISSGRTPEPANFQGQVDRWLRKFINVSNFLLAQGFASLGVSLSKGSNSEDPFHETASPAIFHARRNKPDPAVQPRQTSKDARSRVTALPVPLIKYTPHAASSCNNQHAASHIGIKRFIAPGRI